MIPLAINMYVELAKVSPVILMLCEVIEVHKMTIHIALPNSAKRDSIPVLNFFSYAENNKIEDYGSMEELNLAITFTKDMPHRSVFATTYNPSSSIH